VLEAVAEMHHSLSLAYVFARPPPTPSAAAGRSSRFAGSTQAPEAAATWWGGNDAPFAPERILDETSDAVQLLAASKACARVAWVYSSGGAPPPPPPPRLVHSILSLPRDDACADGRASHYRARISPLMPRLIEVAQACGAGTSNMRAAHADYLGTARAVARLEALRETAQRKRRHTCYLARLGLSDEEVVVLQGASA
jgi:hypothetical protein